MISFIRGTVADLTENSAIIESNCIGFEINMTGNALAQLHIGQEVKLHTYFQVREDAMVLYGFFNKDDLQVFKLLLGVNGVGPKAAVGNCNHNHDSILYVYSSPQQLCCSFR